VILEGNISNEDILDHLEKIEALQEYDPNHLCHENPKTAGWSSYQIHWGLTSGS